MKISVRHKSQRMHLLWCGFIIYIFFVTTRNVECSYQDLRDFDKDSWRGVPMLCSLEDPTNISISCHGVRIIKRVIQELLERASNTPSIEIMNGIKLVDRIDGPTRRARTLKNPIFGLFEDRDLRIRLSVLMPDNIVSNLKNNYSEVSARGSGGFGLGGKKGGNSIILLALMMGKMLGIIGFGTLAFVTMKALTLSSMALLLSLIIAAKKYSSSGQDEHGYHVVYAHDGHHEKRSNDDIVMSPYRGWINPVDITTLDSPR